MQYTPLITTPETHNATE